VAAIGTDRSLPLACPLERPHRLGPTGPLGVLLPLAEKVAQARRWWWPLVTFLPAFGPPDGVDEVLAVAAVAKPRGDQAPGAAQRAAGTHRPPRQRGEVVDFLGPLAPGSVDCLARRDLQRHVLDRAIVAGRQHQLEPGQLGTKPVDDAPVGRRLPALWLGLERFRGVVQCRESLGPFGDQRRQEIPQHRRLAGAGRAVDRKQVAAGPGHRDRLVDGELLAQGQGPVRPRRPAAGRQAIGASGAANLVEPGAYVDVAADVELGSGTQVVAQGGADIARPDGGRHPREVIGDEAVEEVVLDRVGAPPRDDFAADPEAGDGQHVVHSQRRDRASATFVEEAPVEDDRLVPFLGLTEESFLKAEREGALEAGEAVEPAGRRRTRVRAARRGPGAGRKHRRALEEDAVLRYREPQQGALA